MTLRVLFAIIVIVGAVIAATAQTGRLTIPELVRRQAPDPLLQSRITELMPKSLAELAAASDLVIRAKVVSARPYLSKDQRDLYTDYTLVPSQVFLQSDVHVARVPGTVPSIVVTKWGGQTTIDGVQVTAEDSSVRALIQGEELLICLVYDRDSSKYEIVGGTGVFAVRANGTVEPLVRHPHTDGLTGLTAEQVGSELRRLRQ